MAGWEGGCKTDSPPRTRSGVTSCTPLRHGWRSAPLAGLPTFLFDAHPHMLPHACGFALADQGADTRLMQDYLGHRNIQHTVMYTATNPARFERLWR